MRNAIFRAFSKTLTVIKHTLKTERNRKTSNLETTPTFRVEHIILVQNKQVHQQIYNDQFQMTRRLL